jgi:glyoxylase I family protein
VQNARRRVQAIGGLFFRSQDPEALSAWYEKYLGIESPRQQQAGSTVLAPFPKDTDYFGSTAQAWMVNFRVAECDALVERLRSDGITVTAAAEESPYGKFARLNNPQGNPVEPWQPTERTLGSGPTFPPTRSPPRAATP